MYVSDVQIAVVERVNISIPDVLSERLRVVKGRINVSKICQETIEKAVSIEEINAKDIPARDKLIERLRMEREEAVKEWKEAGFADGQKDAEELSYDDFQRLEDEEISEETRDWVREIHFDHYERLDEGLYFEGWIKGALDVWYEIKDQVQAD